MTTLSNTQGFTPEFDLIARHFTRPAANAVLGVGDDCALVDVTNGMDLAVSTDTMVSEIICVPTCTAWARICSISQGP